MSALDERITTAAAAIKREVADVCSRSTSTSVKRRLAAVPSDQPGSSWTDGWDKGWGKYGKTMIESDTITGSVAPASNPN